MTAPDGDAGSLRAVGRSALILTSATICVQVAGIVRELFVASQVGVSSRLDAVLIALALPTSLAGLLTSGIVTALVPAYLATRDSQGQSDARRLAGAVLVWVAMAGIAITALLALFAGVAIALTGPGLAPVDRDSAIRYLVLLSPLTLIAAVSAILYAVNQAEERFRTIAASVIVGPMVTLAIVLLAWRSLELGSLAIGSIVGPLVSLAILFGASVRASVVPRLSLRPPGIDFGSLIRHAAPLTLGSAILQLNVIGDRAIATLLAPGGVSALRYADVLIRTPISAINPAWSSAIYPTLVQKAQGREPGSLAGMTDRMARFSLATFVPIAVLTIAVAPVAVSVAYDRGAFTSGALALTTIVAAGFAPLIVVLMTSPVVRLALNARRLGRVLLIGATVNVILNTVFDVVLGLWLGVAGVALSSSLTAAAVGVYFAWRLTKSEPDFKLRPIARCLLLAAAGSLPGALPLAILSWTGTYPHGTLPGLLTLAVFGIVGLSSYVAFATWIGLDEPKTMVQAVVSSLRRRRAPSGSA